MKANVLIAASAGTGKTQALAERLIALVKGGLEPHEELGTGPAEPLKILGYERTEISI